MTRAAILACQLERRGGKHIKKLDSSTTHVLIDQKVTLERVKKYLGVKDIPEDVIIVYSEWLSSCLSEGKLVDVDEYILREDNCRSGAPTCDHEQRKSKIKEEVWVNSTDAELTRSKNHVQTDTVGEITEPLALSSRSPDKHSVLKPQDDDSDFTDSGDEASKSDISPVVTPNVSPEKLQTSWVCAQPSTSKQENHNEFITNKLQVLATSYANTKDQWRALGYKKAIASIKNYHKKLETWEECSNLPFVGERLAKKIWEIIQTGHLRRLDHVDPKQDAINLFVGVWGDDLTLADNGEQRKYLGVCKLPGENTKHRRLDIIVVPYNEWACSLLYFTGSDYFNRSMTLLAKKNEMSLSEHSLNTGVVRRGSEKIFEGTPLPVFNEKDVFDYLGLQYREPHERDW